MNATERKMLQRVLDAELEGRLPFQAKSKLLPMLHAAGLVEPMKRTFGEGERFPVICSGWRLTPKGKTALSK